MEKFTENVQKFGFGLMRLPRLADGTIDVDQTAEMADRFLAAGMNYFDTAYVYEGSEEAIRKALVERVPRDKFYLTSKLNVTTNDAKDAASARQEFYTSLERTGAKYLDFYLLHAMNKENYSKFTEWDIFSFVKELKEKGLIRHYGFSFHDDPETLDRILTEHPDLEFVQLQINYIDWESPSVQSRACHEVAVKHDKPIVIMEPIKGGMLASPPQQVVDLMKQADPDASPASWALRFAASLKNVMVVLSGMSSLEQMEENLKTMKDFQPLSEAEQQVIVKARETINAIPQIPCTGCRYCVKDCPKHISIPRVFEAMNKILVYNNREQAERTFGFAVEDGGKPSECIHCGSCERNCPQHIQIRSWLEKAAAEFEK